MRYLDDFAAYQITNIWTDTAGSPDKTYVVQTSPAVIERCILMATDPGDLVLDPTCGSGTTAYVAEQWGRRWITIDTSRVALALARTRLMAARYSWYLLADSPEGRRKEAELTGKPPLDGTTYDDLRQGFVYERVPHITLKSIANNSRIDDIWEKWQAALEPLRAALNAGLDKSWEEWEIPREAGAGWPEAALADHAAVVAGAHRPPAGDRRCDRPGRRCRKALRPPLCGHRPGARRRPVHGREPVAAPYRRRPTRLNWSRTSMPPRENVAGAVIRTHWRAAGRFLADRHRLSEKRRHPPIRQERQDRFRQRNTVARPLDRRRGAFPRARRDAPRRDPDRPGIRHDLAPRSDRRRARGQRGRASTC